MDIPSVRSGDTSAFESEYPPMMCGGFGGYKKWQISAMAERICPLIHDPHVPDLPADIRWTLPGGSNPFQACSEGICQMGLDEIFLEYPCKLNGVVVTII